MSKQSKIKRVEHLLVRIGEVKETEWNVWGCERQEQERKEDLFMFEFHVMESQLPTK